MATNTEKPTGKAEQKKTAPVSAPKVENKNMQKAPVKKEEKVEDKKTEVKADEKVDKKKEKKQPVKKIKKEFVVVNARSVPISTKDAKYICKFVKKKRIGDAIRDLEDVIARRKAVPMKGEIPHRHGKIMSGRFPQRASKEFIVLLKSLLGNANNHDVEEPIVSEAIANKAARPFGRFGRWQRKRTHVKLVAREFKLKEKKK